MSIFHRSGAFRARLLTSSALILGLSLSPVSGHADTDTLASDPDLDTVVVSATRIPTPLVDVGNTVSVVTDADIDTHQWRDLPSALQTVPGLNLVQNGGPGGATSVFLRGTNANHTKVLIDGIEASDPSTADGSFDFSQILTDDIARIEVLRGPQSGLYGSDAIGGLINIITKKPEGPLTFTGRVEGGSQDTANQSAGLSGASGGIYYSLDVSHFHAGDTPVTPAHLEPPGQSVIGDSDTNTTVSARIGADLSDVVGVDLITRYTDTALRFTGQNYNVYPDIPAAQQSTQDETALFTRGQLRLSLFDGVFKNKFGVAYTYYDRDYVDPYSGYSNYTGDRIKGDWQGDIALGGGNHVLLGAEDQQDRLSGVTPAASIDNRAGYVELQSGVYYGLSASINGRLDDNDRYGTYDTGRAAVSYTVPVTGTRLKASYGSGFKAPSLSDLFISYPSFGFFANPDLKPETSEGYDAGFEQPLDDDKLTFGATWFHNDIKDLIDINATGSSDINIGRAETYGVEAFASVEPVDGVRLRANYTYTMATDRLSGEELPRRPRHRASLDASWQIQPDLSVAATLLYVGSWIDANRDYSVTGLHADPYATVNVSADYAVTEQIGLFARIDNLLDRRYEDPIGFQKPRIGCFGGIKVKFGMDGWKA